MVAGDCPPGQATTPEGMVPGADPPSSVSQGASGPFPPVRGGMPFTQAVVLEAPKLAIGTSRTVSPPFGQDASALYVPAVLTVSSWPACPAV